MHQFVEELISKRNEFWFTRFYLQILKQREK